MSIVTKKLIVQFLSGDRVLDLVKLVVEELPTSSENGTSQSNPADDFKRFLLAWLWEHDEDVQRADRITIYLIGHDIGIVVGPHQARMAHRAFMEANGDDLSAFTRYFRVNRSIIWE